MTIADTHAPEPAADIDDTGAFQVLVSYYDAEDFTGDCGGARTVRRYAALPTGGRAKKLRRW